jgi:hypothetical protein
MTQNKTQATNSSVDDFLDQVVPPRRRDQGRQLRALFDQVTGWTPRLWGPSIIGYGRYDYTYDSGRSGSFLATGFSPRKAALSIYIMPGDQDYGAILDRLGPHKMGKSCLYITRLDACDMQGLGELIQQGLDDLGRKWPVLPD